MGGKTKLVKNEEGASNRVRAVLFIAPGVLEVPNTRGGGIEQNIFSLASKMNIRCSVFSPRGYSPRQDKGGARIDYSLIPASGVYPRNPHVGLSDLPELIRLLFYYLSAGVHIVRHSRKFHAIVVFDYFLGIIPILSAKLLEKTCVYMEYNMTPWLYGAASRYPAAHALQMRFAKFVASRCSFLTANSPSIAEGMMRAGIPSHKLMIVPTILDTRGGPRRLCQEHRLSTRTSSQVIYIGRLVEERGADMLPPLITHVLKKRNDVTFVIVGDGPIRGQIEQLLGDPRFAGRIRIMGQLPRAGVFDMIAGSDLAIFVSHKENFGSLALEECLQLGLPVVATNVGSTKLRVRDGVNGLLANPTPLSIAEAVTRFLSDSKLRLRIKSNLVKDNLSQDSRKIMLSFSRALMVGRPVEEVRI